MSNEGRTEIDRLTVEAHTALSQGDTAKANKLFEKRAALTERMYGDQPIVGGNMRTT